MKLDLGERVSLWGGDGGGHDLEASLWESLKKDLGRCCVNHAHHELKDSIRASTWGSLRNRLEDSLVGR